MPIDFTRI